MTPIEPLAQVHQYPLKYFEQHMHVASVIKKLLLLAVDVNMMMALSVQ